MDELTTLADVAAGDILKCSCGAPLGTFVEVNKHLWLAVGAVELNYGHGRCTECRRIWHYDEGDIRLARIVSHKNKE